MILMMSHNSGPSWCEKHNCQCPCHVKDKWYYSLPSMLFGILAAASLFIWALFTILSWAIPINGNPTLLDVLKGQWHFLAQLMHRIY
jgi:hypothetical protein